MITLLILWICQSLIGYWICRNSIANAYWNGYGKRTLYGINLFNSMNENWAWHLIPVIGFYESYKFVEQEGKIRWDAMTIKYIREAWSKK